MTTCTCRDAASACGTCLGTVSRAEHALSSHAEAYRLVEEARQMRAERNELREALEQVIEAASQCLADSSNKDRFRYRLVEVLEYASIVLEDQRADSP